MSRTRVAWLLSLPVSLSGMLLAHELAWQFGSHRHEEGAGHGYLQYGAVLVALAIGSILVAALAQLFRAVGGAGVARAPSARVFAIVPVVGFLVQEHLEHLAASRELEVTYFLSTPFLLGLALQLPFAVAALGVARLILGFVHAMARAVSAPPPLGAAELLRAFIPAGADLPLRPALARRHAGRAPPAFPLT